MGLDEQRVATDSLIWVANIACSVVLIFSVKLLMQKYLLTAATCISGLNFLTCAAVLWAATQLRFMEPGPSIPVKHTVAYTLIACVSITTANYSLQSNSLGIYQLAKLLLAPAVCGLEVWLVGRKFTPTLVACICVVLVGVGIISVNDVTITLPGVVVAALFVGSTALQQVMCGRLQAMHKVAPHHLLAITAPIQGGLLLLVGPFVDRIVTGSWISQWDVNVPGLEMLAVSCAVAVAVNVTQFILLGRFTATTFQVLGHSKSVLVLLGGGLLFHEALASKEWLGVAVAVAGMAAYGAVAISQPVPGHSSTPTVRAPFLKAVPAGSITGQRSSLEAGQSEGGGIPAAAPLPASTAT